MKLNNTMAHIFKEAVLDSEQGAIRGDASAAACMERFQSFITLGEVPLSEMDFIYRHYQNQQKSLVGAIDPRLDGLKTEINYMLNYLNSHYDFKEMGEMLVVTLKE